MKLNTVHKEYAVKLREWIWLILATVSFWGIFYPNFTLTQDVCKIYVEESTMEETDDEAEQLYEKMNKIKQDGISITDLKKGKVRVKSRFLNFIKKWWN